MVKKKSYGSAVSWVQPQLSTTLLVLWSTKHSEKINIFTFLFLYNHEKKPLGIIIFTEHKNLRWLI
jgi:hypothetical protein